MNKNTPLKRHKALISFSHDHHHGLVFCRKIRKALEQKHNLEDLKQTANSFWENNLVPHFQLEEKYVFTVLENGHPMVKKAKADHKKLAKLFSNSTELLKTLGLIEETLESHIRFEERILFPEITKSATSKQLALIEQYHPLKENS